MDLRAPRERIVGCVEEIEGIALGESDPIGQRVAVRDAITACLRDLEKYSHDPSGFCVDLRSALDSLSQRTAQTNPGLSLVFERAIDCIWVQDARSLRPPLP